MRARIVLLLLSMLPGFAAADMGDTRRAAKTTLEKIVDPLPTYDPFEYSTPAPAYFPDEIDKQARQVLVDTLMNRPDKLRAHIDYFENKDAELSEERGTVTGLTHHIKDLSHNTILDREEYLEEQRRELAGAPSEAQERIIRARLLHDELEQADSLMSQSRMSRWGALLNRLLQSMDLVKIASGNYVGAAVETAIAELQRLQTPTMPLTERKALALYRRFVERFPGDPRRREALEKIESLSKDRKRQWVHEHLRKAGEHLDKGKLAQAEFEAYLAALADPEAEAVTARFEEIEAMRERREANRKEASTVAAADPLANLPDEQAAEVKTLLYNLVKRDADALEAQAQRLAHAYQGGALGELAGDAHAVAMEIRGEREQAKRKLAELASSAPSPRARDRARALLDSPEYNRLGTVDAARTQHRIEQVKFVLLGQDLLEKNLMFAVGPMISHGVAGASSLGAANVMMMGTNLLQVLSSNPVSNQEVIDAAGDFVRLQPDSKKAADVYEILGDAYDSRGHFNKALYYYKMSGKRSPDEIAELEEEAGNKLVQMAERTRDKTEQHQLYTAVLDLYPQTKAADEARAELSRLVRADNGGLRLSKRFLLEHPELHGPRGLGLKATLFDGNEDNIEIAAKGLNIVDGGTVLLHYDTPWGIQSRRYAVDTRKITRFETVLRQKHYDLAALDVDRRDKNTPGGFKNLPEKLKRLDVRRDDVDLRFFRDAETAQSRYPRVLGHELLTQKEIDPQKGYRLPNVQGSVTTSGISLSGDIPASFLGDELVIGNDANSPYAGLRFPIPFLEGFVPVDFMISARPGGPSVTPYLRTGDDSIRDPHLYR